MGLAGEDVSETSDEGRRFGDYELEAEIARGGMGVIYCARHVALDRIVAVKMVSGEGLRSASGRMRFQIEAEAIASLDHPNIGSFDRLSFRLNMEVLGAQVLGELAQSRCSVGDLVLDVTAELPKGELVTVWEEERIVTKALRSISFACDAAFTVAGKEPWTLGCLER